MPPYTRVNWQDGEEGGTPMSAANFNRMDKGIADLDAEAYRKPASGIPGSDLAVGAIDFDQLSSTEPYPMTPSLREAAEFAAQMLGSYLYNQGWSRDTLAQAVRDELGGKIDSAQGRSIATAVIAEWVGNTPAALDTLGELAAALGNDPNFATTVMNLIGQKAALTHGHPASDITDSTFLGRDLLTSSTQAQARTAIAAASQAAVDGKAAALGSTTGVWTGTSRPATGTAGVVYLEF